MVQCDEGGSLAMTKPESCIETVFARKVQRNIRKVVPSIKTVTLESDSFNLIQRMLRFVFEEISKRMANKEET